MTTLASASTTLVLAFVAIVAIEHVAQPGLTPGYFMVSEYARAGGAAGAAAIAAFLCWSASLLLLAAALLQGGARGRPIMRGALALVVLAALGLAAAAVFRTQAVRGVVPRDVARTAVGELHDLGTGLAEIALFGAAFATAIIARPRRPLRAVSIAAILLAIAVGPLLSLMGADMRGLRQRLLIGVACTWQVSLLRTIRRGGPPFLQAPDSPAE